VDSEPSCHARDPVEQGVASERQTTQVVRSMRVPPQHAISIGEIDCDCILPVVIPGREMPHEDPGVIADRSEKLREVTETSHEPHVDRDLIIGQNPDHGFPVRLNHVENDIDELVPPASPLEPPVEVEAHSTSRRKHLDQPGKGAWTLEVEPTRGAAAARDPFQHYRWSDSQQAGNGGRIDRGPDEVRDICCTR